MFKKKTFIIDELNYVFLPLAIFQRLIGRKVYFFRLSKTLRSQKTIRFFNFVGLKWLNFQDYEIKKVAEIGQNTVILQKQFANFLENLNVADVLKRKLTEKGCGKNDLKAFALTKVSQRTRYFCEIIKFLDYLRKDNKGNFIIVGQFPDFLVPIYKKEIENKATLLNFYSFYFVFRIYKLLYDNIKFNLKNLFIRGKKETFDLKKFNTIFFPHQGIYYGNIYKKDQFYSKKKNSNFYPSNILHLSADGYLFLADKHLSGSLTNEFYKKNKIVEIDFISLGSISLKEIIFDIWKFISKYYFFSKNTLHSTLFFLDMWILIKNSLNRLEKLPNAKVAIFGYDLLSPRDIAIACRIKGIETIATQERFLSIWEGDSFFIFDHYLVINKEIETLILNERLGLVKKIKSIGPIRSDFINEDILNENVFTEKNVLVLDSRSIKDFYRNGMAKFGNWRQNHLFYENILKLAKQNQNIKFIIKGKNYDFINIPYFEDIKNLINNSLNVELHNDKYESTYELLQKIPLTIARHTSLIDELLFKKRSVIIYDTAGYPSLFFNYGENLIVKNYNELEKKFNMWKQDAVKFNKNVINESNKFFPINEPKIKVHDLLHSYLQNEFEY